MSTLNSDTCTVAPVSTQSRDGIRCHRYAKNVQQHNRQMILRPKTLRAKYMCTTKIILVLNDISTEKVYIMRQKKAM